MKVGDKVSSGDVIAEIRDKHCHHGRSEAVDEGVVEGNPWCRKALKRKVNA